MPAGFEENGCYHLNTITNREGLGTYTSKDISLVMENCNKNAGQKGHHFFGIKRKKGNNKYMCVTGITDSEFQLLDSGLFVCDYWIPDSNH